jgi:hypothetical protein
MLTINPRGGVRGVIELWILKMLLIEIGHDIPIQQFFDLAIGTSAGMRKDHLNDWRKYTKDKLRWYHCSRPL